MSTLNCTYIQSKAASTPVTFQDLNGTEIGQLCRAWVNFNGTTASPSTIRASFNVSSVTKNGTGNYNINMTTSLADANYCINGTGWSANSSVQIVGGQINTFTPTSSAFRVRFNSGAALNNDTSAGDVDPTYAFVSVFR